MKIEIQLDPNQQETKVIIITEQMTDEVKEIMDRLSKEQPRVLAGFRGEQVEILEPEDIYRIYGASQKIYAVTASGEYQLRSRLYELEERLTRLGFIRISNSEIVNVKKIKSFDLSYTGTIGVVLSNGTSTFVSRRYMTRIKQALGI